MDKYGQTAEETFAMSNNTGNAQSRRDFLNKAGCFATACSLAGAGVPRVHAAENNTIRLALIGWGRGTGPWPMP